MILTLKKLHTQGRLSIGDTLHFSDHGDCELVAVLSDGRLQCKTSDGRYINAKIDFGPDTRIVRVN